MPNAAATAPVTLETLCPLLQVFDMRASLAFYRDVLGFEVVQSAPPGATADAFGWAWLQHGDAELMLNSAYDSDAARPPVADGARVAAHDDTALYIGCRDLDAMYERLRAHGIDARPPRTAHYGMRQLYVADTDGFNICFQWRADATESSTPDGLAMHAACQTCGTALDASATAMICSFECTFCPSCAAATSNVCQNCGGELVRRPRRIDRT